MNGKKKWMVLAGLLLVNNAFAQVADSLSYAHDCEPQDLTDIARKIFHIKAKPKQKNTAIFIAPVFGSSPSTGFVFGATIQGAFQLKGANISAFQANVQYTTKKQFLLFLKNNVYAKGNKLFFSGDWRYFSYSETTYGLGTNAPLGTLPYYFHFNSTGEPVDSLAQPAKFKYFKLHQTASWKIWPQIYAGPGIHLDLYSKIQDLKLDTPGRYITSHYAFSKKYGFDPGKYTVVGVSINLVYDTRDNIVNTYHGMYANINFRINPEFLGSDQNSSSLWTEWRYFQGLSKKRPQKVLAFWLIGNFTTSGTLPYLTLPALGYDQRNKSGRGYANGRYRGEQLIYAETEYRFPISKCTHTLGGVVFINAVTANNKDAKVGMFDYIRVGFGAGLRILFNKKARMNMQIDYGQGKEGGGVYFGASEVF